MGYDYIGAPIGRYAPTWHAVGARVGNGGISLRRVSACLRMLDRHEDWLYGDLPMQEAFFACEDAFFGACGRWDTTFRVPDVSTALEFAVQDCLQHAAKRMREGWRPFGCHAWLAGAEKEVWKSVIEAEGYDLSGMKFPDKYPLLDLLSETQLADTSRAAASSHVWVQRSRSWHERSCSMRSLPRSGGTV